MRRFFRLSGGGNDFLALASPASHPSAEEIRSLCRRGLSVGADGLFVLERLPESIRMRYFNADGRPAELCLNGTRCAIRLATHLGWGRDIVEIETGAGVLRGWAAEDGSVVLELPRPQAPRAVAIDHAGESYRGWFSTVGVPHFVVPWLVSLASAPVDDLGPHLRHHPRWGESGANIDFVRFPHRHRLEIRTYERGVETETLACGTGVMAATSVGLETGDLELPVRALTLGGFELAVDRQDKSNWRLAGDARLVAEGELHPGAYESPPPPAWS